MREEARQEDMVEGIVRGYSRAQKKEEALERLSRLLGDLELIAQELEEITKALKKATSHPSQI